MDFIERLPIELVIALIASSLVSALTGIAFLFFRSRGLFGEPIPISHKIAIVGLPESGKTTLITAIFELIMRGIHLPEVRLHGLNTIKTVNKNLEALSGGKKIAPTLEDQVFVYRFSYIKKATPWFSRVYDVEIADFPGQYTQRISEYKPTARPRRGHAYDYEAPSDGSATATRGYPYSRTSEYERTNVEDEFLDLDYTLFDNEFFSWIASSREFLFVVDLSRIYSAENVIGAIAEFTSKARTSWQVIEDAVSERGLGSARSRSVHIVFTKFDSLMPVLAAGKTLSDLREALVSDVLMDKSEDEIVKLKDLVRERGLMGNLTSSDPHDQGMTRSLVAQNEKFFADLIDFFRSRKPDFAIMYTSMVIHEGERYRLGVHEVLKASLP